MKIVITDAKTVTNGDIDLNMFSKYGELEIFQLTPASELVNRLKDADAVLLNKTVLDENILSQCDKLKFIGLFATGYNNIDVKYCHEHGIIVSNAGSYSTDAVAQCTWGFILNHFNQVANYGSFVREGGWSNSETFSAFCFPTKELPGKTLGLVGYGSIGRRVAEIGRAFHMNIIAFPHSKEKIGTVDADGTTYVDFDTLLTTADVVSCHCPLNEDSKELFDAAAFAKMKQGAFFVNTARGGVIVEQALREALDSGHLSGAGIDVLTLEPMTKDNVLREAKNITMSPHIAWAPLETRIRLMDIVADNLQNFIDGHPTHVVS